MPDNNTLKPQTNNTIINSVIYASDYDRRARKRCEPLMPVTLRDPIRVTLKHAHHVYEIAVTIERTVKDNIKYE